MCDVAHCTPDTEQGEQTVLPEERDEVECEGSKSLKQLPVLPFPAPPPREVGLLVWACFMYRMTTCLTVPFLYVYILILLKSEELCH